MEFVKKMLIAIGMAAGILAIYLGSYLPFVKAQRYVSLVRSFNSGEAQTLDQALEKIDGVIKFYSPIGQEEDVRYVLNDILNIIIQTQQGEAIDRSLVEHVEPYALQNDVRHTFVMGEIYRALWEKYGRENYYQKTESYYEKSLALAPHLPQLLNSMFGFYKANGNQEKMVEIGQIILKYWPEYDYIREQMQ